MLLLTDRIKQRLLNFEKEKFPYSTLILNYSTGFEISRIKLQPTVKKTALNTTASNVSFRN